jgi:hypothetical protein
MTPAPIAVRRQQSIVVGDLLAQVEPPLVFRELLEGFDLLLAVSLRGEVGLPQGHDLFLGVGILHDQIGTVARQAHVVDFALGTRSDRHHFPYVLEMVAYLLTTHLAGQLGLPKGV